MNQHLQTILNLIQQAAHLSADEKTALSKATNNADKDFEITTFKLDRTEKVKRTTAILLEETIEELEQKRKAVEAQNSELEIESSLERVRTTAMGMRKPDDLLTICEILFAELHHMGFSELRNAMINIHDDDKGSFLNYDFSEVSGPTVTTIVYNSHPATESLVQQVRKSNDAFAEFTIKGSQLDEWREYRKGMGEKDDPRLDNIDTFSYYFYSIGTGAIGISTYSSITEEKRTVLKRFRNVFDFAYRRYTDVAQAEAQAREAQIQLAMERVRARTMAMQKSSELSDAAALLFKQVMALGVPAFSCGFNIFEKGQKECAAWMSTPDGNGLNPAMKIPLTEDPNFIRFYASKQNDEEFYVIDMWGKRMQEHFRYLRATSPHFDRVFTEIENAGLSLPKTQIHHLVNFSHGNLMFITLEPCPEAHDIFRLFGKVFEQTYTRFLDLQKAEAQAREAQIELSLESVRAKTMAMHNSQDVGDTVAALFEEFVKLDISTNRCGILIHSDSPATEVWTAKANASGAATLIIGQLDTSIHTMLHEVREAWKNKESFFAHELTGEDIKNYYNAINNSKYYPTQFDLTALPSKEFHSDFYFAEGSIFAFTAEPIPPEAAVIFKRFTAVFGQTYRRYLDLKKAEAQARHAQIEAAMEKVRARALAMQKPEELIEVAQVLRKEMGLLGVEELETNSIYIHDEIADKTECWYAIKDENKLVAEHMIIDLKDTWVGRQMFKFYHSDEKTVSIPMQGDNRKEWIHYCSKKSKLLDGFYGENITNRTYHLNKFSNGYIGAASPGDISAESRELLQRATTVFSLAYTRFSDLHHAEAQAREAKTEAALERVRSRTLAMQKSDELAETAAVLFKQLINLGIAPNRLYIGIIKDDDGHIEFWVTDEDGSKVSTQFIGDTNRNASMKKMYDAWKLEKKSLTVDMQGKELENYFHYLAEDLHVPFKEGLSQKRRIQSIAFFGKGFIGIASPDEQPEATINLLERFAAVFNLTYTRFNDLKVAEAHAIQAEEDLIKLQTEKKRAEDALTELRATQTQLIQSEKMASLGELTAGIAHEIQNPLNFVNNFSEVSNELIDEMNAELDKGDIEEAKAIAHDIKQNLEKINHHGKRADGIVKGMLQHSRTSAGQMELTDINILADEYLRLAYHGLRAKNKSFNATLQTDFDTTIGKINIVPQDIGRVILNLINNAFYAVAEKKKLNAENYEPTVWTSTKKTADAIVIIVRDNGNGIPQKITDKIFQPFFTTKPTGLGTGLGLSLSYDIVKAHGGEIKVETKEGEETKFIIQLPIG